MSAFWGPPLPHTSADIICTCPQMLSHLKCLNNLFFDVGVMHFRRHHVQKLWQVDGAALVCVHGVGEVLLGLA